MAIIIDTNIASKIFPKTGKTIYPILFKWLFENKDGKIATSLCLLKELEKIESVSRRIAVLKMSGKYIEVPESEIENEKNNPSLTDCNSNDKCILAIMRISGVRLVCTDDRSTLIPYLRSGRGIIRRPGGKRYTERDRRTAENLLRKYGAYGNNYKT